MSSTLKTIILNDEKKKTDQLVFNTAQNQIFDAVFDSLTLLINIQGY